MNTEKRQAYLKAYSVANRERIRANKAASYLAKREYFLTAHKKYAAEHSEERKVYMAHWNAANTERIKAYGSAQYSAYPERNKAKAAVRRAVNSGRIVQLPCWICGKEQVEAHHPNYDAPLDVVWLCRSHHKQLHAEV